MKMLKMTYFVLIILVGALGFEPETKWVYSMLKIEGSWNPGEMLSLMIMYSFYYLLFWYSSVTIICCLFDIVLAEVIPLFAI